MDALKYTLLSIFLGFLFVGGCYHAADKEMERREINYEHKY